MNTKPLFFIYCMLLLQTFNVQAKPVKKALINPYQYSSDAVTGSPFSAIIGLEKNRSVYLASKYRTTYLSAISTLYSYVGEYDKAIEAFDTAYPAPPNIADRPLHSSFKNKTSVNAAQSILSRASKHQIVLLNEASHVPAHRAFALQLLQGLYDQGFRYFAVEALSPFDQALNQRSYPEIGITGTDTNEPVFAHLLRAAKHMGFELVSYEEKAPCRATSTKENCETQRQRNQAKTLYKKTLQKLPKAKVFVYFEHKPKKSTLDITPMGTFFQQMTGIKPLSIDQQSFNPHSHPTQENGFYRRALQQFKFDQPMVLKNKSGNFWVQPHLKPPFDLQVFHPRTRYRMRRPAWRFLEGHKPTLLKNPCPEYPCLLLARSTKESDQAVPFDQVILRSAKDIKPLLLPAGKYTIQAIGSIDNILTEKLLTVK